VLCPHPVCLSLSLSTAPPLVGRTGLLSGHVETGTGTLVTCRKQQMETFVLFTNTRESVVDICYINIASASNHDNKMKRLNECSTV